MPPEILKSEFRGCIVPGTTIINTEHEEEEWFVAALKTPEEEDWDFELIEGKGQSDLPYLSFDEKVFGECLYFC